MIKRLFLVLIVLPTIAFSAKILSHNIYERTDRIDIMITFDTPYEGTLYQSEQSNHIKLTLNGATVEEPIMKNLSNDFLISLTIAPIGDHAEIILNTPSKIDLKASKTIDGYGLRLRLSKKISSGKNTVQTSTSSISESLPTQKRSSSVKLSTSYYIAIALLIIAVIVLYFFRKKVSNAAKGGSWLMGGRGLSATSTQSADIIFQKPIDANNKVILLEFQKRRYLVISGTSNMLLDTFTSDNKPIRTQEQFNKMLSQNSDKLDEFMNLNNQLDSYKEKAGAI